MNKPHSTPIRQSGDATNAPSAANAVEPTVIFVSDSHFHLKPDNAELDRLQQFYALLELSHQVDHLVLVGDIFDFWFDYPHFRLRGYDRLLSALDQVRDAGTQMHFIGGNHDIWAAEFFHRRYQCAAGGQSRTINFGSRRVHLTHGDGLLKFDWAYNSFRAIVRTRLGIALAKALHPEILFQFSSWLSGHSRGANRDEAKGIEKMSKRWFEKQTDPDWDLMIVGHVHHGVLLEKDSRKFVSLAGWFDPLSYGLLQNGDFQLLDFSRDPRPIFTIDSPRR
ncbi:MAG: UDP-2,3-diacylglucosamine hydrolase [Candidatus Krumholzibacteriia bacterium]|jgi:UDP-2,3-diacylglucosamine hydrolase